MTLKLTDAEVAEIRVLYATGKVTQAALGRQFRVSHGTIHLIVTDQIHVGTRSWNARRTKGEIREDGRECSRCSKFKPWHEFHFSSPSATGHMSACKDCRSARCAELRRVPFVARERTQVKAQNLDRRLMSVEDVIRYERDQYLRYMYGITLTQYELLEQEQGGKCALCREEGAVKGRRGKKRGVLAVDHDHACREHSSKRACTLCIRGLLCDNCNWLLGFAEARAVLAVRFDDYLGLRPLLTGGGDA